MNVFLITAITADGFIARHKNDRSFDWTSKEDKDFYVQKIKKAKFIVIGSKTFSTFTRYPKGTTYAIYTRKPEKFVNPKPDIIKTIPTKQPPKTLVKELKKQGAKQVAICGGASIYTMFLKSGIVNKLYLTIEPIIFGKGITLFNQSIEEKLKLIKIHRLSKKTIVLEYNLK